MEYIKYNKEIPIRYEVDVFVAGGGPAGVAAAVTAARMGSSVYLAEAGGCLGGMGTAGFVPAFSPFTDGVNWLAKGIGEEIYNRYLAYGGLKSGIKAEVLKEVYEDIMLESGVTFTYFTQLIDAVTDDGCVREAVLSSKSGTFGVKANMYVDGTGDGDLAVMAGAQYEKGDERGRLMPGTLCSLWSDVDWSRAVPFQHKEKMQEALDANIFTVKDKHLPGMCRVGEHMAGGNLGHAFGVDGTDEVSLTQAVIEQRKRLKEYEVFYKKYIDGFENISLVSTGALMGIRESRRIMGDYVLNLADFEARANFEDEIGRYCYQIDVHAAEPEEYDTYYNDFYKYKYKPGESYGIPYRILTPKGLNNLLVAGRCVSTDRYMQGSVRVMPGCYITGQAAGAAAHVAIGENTHIRGFDIEILKSKLSELEHGYRKK